MFVFNNCQYNFIGEREALPNTSFYNLPVAILMKCQPILRYLYCLCLIVNELHRNTHFHVVAVSREYRIDKLGVEIVPVYRFKGVSLYIVGNP